MSWAVGSGTIVLFNGNEQEYSHGLSSDGDGVATVYRLLCIGRGRRSPRYGMSGRHVIGKWKVVITIQECLVLTCCCILMLVKKGNDDNDYNFLSSSSKKGTIQSISIVYTTTTMYVLSAVDTKHFCSMGTSFALSPVMHVLEQFLLMLHHRSSCYPDASDAHP